MLETPAGVRVPVGLPKPLSSVQVVELLAVLEAAAAVFVRGRGTRKLGAVVLSSERAAAADALSVQVVEEDGLADAKATASKGPSARVLECIFLFLEVVCFGNERLG